MRAVSSQGASGLPGWGTGHNTAMLAASQPSGMSHLAWGSLLSRATVSQDRQFWRDAPASGYHQGLDA